MELIKRDEHDMNFSIFTNEMFIIILDNCIQSYQMHCLVRCVNYRKSRGLVTHFNRSVEYTYTSTHLVDTLQQFPIEL